MKLKIFVILVTFVSSIYIETYAQFHTTTALAQRSAGKMTPFVELRALGNKLARAVLSKDIKVILHHDRPDLVDDDRSLLDNKTSHLYCYLFDSSCMKPKGRSVYEVLSKAQNLTIEVKDLGKGKDGSRYGLIYFFDSKTVDPQKLALPDYLCEEGGKEIITWTFKRVKDHWESAHPPFDAETDVHCSS